MKMILICTLAIVMSIAPTFAEKGSGSTGTRGGGSEMDGRLRDLVDQGNCIPQTGEEFAEEFAPGTNEVLNKLFATHWYLAYSIKRELREINVCMVQGTLKRVRTTDVDSLIYYYEKNDTIVGLREGMNVFVSRPALMLIAKADRPYFAIHEAMHAFFPWDLEKRNEKLRRTVFTIEQVVKKGLSLEKLNKSLEFNESTLPEISDKVQENKAMYVALLDVKRPMDERYEAYKRIKSSSSDFMLLRRDSKEVEEVGGRLENEYRDAVLQQQVDRARTLWQWRIQTDLEIVKNQTYDHATFAYKKGNMPLFTFLLSTKNFDVNAVTWNFYSGRVDLVPNGHPALVPFVRETHQYCAFREDTFAVKAVLDNRLDILQSLLADGRADLSVGPLYYPSEELSANLSSRILYSEQGSGTVNRFVPFNLAVLLNRVEMVKEMLAYPGLKLSEG